MRTRLLILAAACAWGVQALAAPPSATPDQPFSMDAQALRDFERETAPFVAHARKTFPAAKARFQEGLGAGFEFYVVKRVVDDKGRVEICFVLVDAIADGRIEGRLASKPDLVQGIRQGDKLSFPEAEILEWTITDPQGREEGNLSGYLGDTWVPVDQACKLMWGDGKEVNGSRPVPDWRHVPAGSAAFEQPLAAGEKDPILRCLRRGVVPYLSDTRVLAAGMPLAIMEPRSGRVSVFESVDGQLRLRMIKGEMTELETQVAQVFLDAAQRQFSDAAAP